jgi:hypothetical protein
VGEFESWRLISGTGDLLSVFKGIASPTSPDLSAPMGRRGEQSETIEHVEKRPARRNPRSIGKGLADFGNRSEKIDMRAKHG